MARYFFHTEDGGVDRDEEGMELPSIEEARTAPVRYAGSVLAEDQNVLWNGRDFRVMVSDASGQLIFTVVTIAIEGNADV